MSAAFSPSFMVMQRPLGSTTAFSIDSLIGGPPQPSPGHFVYTGYPMFMPYRSVVLQPPPPPPPPALQQALPAGHHPHPQIPSLQGGFCSSLAQGLTQGMALTSTLMASLPGGFSPSQQHQEAARKFGSQALHAVFDKTQELRLDAEDGKSFLQGKESAALQAFHDADTAVQTSTGRRACAGGFSRDRSQSPGQNLHFYQLRKYSEHTVKTTPKRTSAAGRMRASPWTVTWTTALMTTSPPCVTRRTGTAEEEVEEGWMTARTCTAAAAAGLAAAAAAEAPVEAAAVRTGGGGRRSPASSCWSWRRSSTARSTCR
ncbi:homeobox protein GBX-2 isoform X2 [Epinephelus moara]|uniref:homeobox protein GBX-2 isoform X2 n=1 Tax=Epinephelus moara TaxID=300413 RepID=UPI00214EFACA|nr:homeobox protein GBX-2 isoform X2 [Epinephelus moara]